jgi:hypothetical protein
MKTFFYFLLLAGLAGCAVSKKSPALKKYSASELRTDYNIFRNMLEESHPGLYWFTPKDSMDYYFARGEQMLRDSMQEPQFRNVLSYVLSNIHCGHTTARPSTAFAKKGDSLRGKFFPLVLKFWPDTAAVVANFSKSDSIISRGCLLTSIDGEPINKIVDSLFHFLSRDGYNETHLYQSLSNGGAFSSLYLNVFGYKPKYAVGFIDTAGIQRTKIITVHSAPRDTTKHPPAPKISRRKRRQQQINFNRKFSIDSAQHFGLMELNTFTKGNGLRSFFRSSFKKLKSENVSSLVIDLRINGGGNVNFSNLLTRYITDHSFRIADSLFAITRHSRYSSYMKGYFWDHVFMFFFTHKRADGYYHFRYYEKKYFQPKKKNHFNGDVYVLTGGNTFSASSIFARTVRSQENVVLVGEETGGGNYGNNAWIIPDVTLPQTGVRFRLPLFRLVTDKNIEKGHGVEPEVYAGPTLDAIKRNVDFKMEIVIKMISAKNNN